MVDIGSVVGRTTRVRLVFVVASVLIASVCHAQWVASTRYDSGFGGFSFGEVQRITKGPDGALWFTTGCQFIGLGGWICANRIGRITTSGSVTSFPIPSSSDTAGITTGPDGALWFTETFANNIGRITTGGSVTEYPIPTPNSGVGEITAGADGALWFVESTANKIGRVTVTGNITEYTLPGSVTAPTSIATGSDGALWFAYRGGIARMTTAGSLSATYQTGGLVVPGGVPGQIIAGPDGALWFTETSSGSPLLRGIGRLTTAGAMSEWAVPQHGSGAFVLYGITAGSDGAVWFIDGDSNVLEPGPTGYLGRITPSGTLTEYPVPPIGPTGINCCQGPGITGGPDGALWYVGSDGILVRSPACGLGLGVSYASPTLTMSFDLGIAIPGGGTGNWSIYLISSRVIPLYSQMGPAVVPPKHFSIPLPLGNVGFVGVLSTLSTTAGGLACADVQFTNTGGTGMTINQLRDVLRSSGIVPGLR
jgi:virginiamycin B lyase